MSSRETLATQTQMSLEELDKIGVPLTCPYCPGGNTLQYTHMSGTHKMLIECDHCDIDDEVTVQERLVLHNTI